MIEQIKSIADEVSVDVVKLRRQLHAHPELSFEEARTAQLIASTLEKVGLRVETGIGGTGVIGHLIGRRPGRCLVLRADMDALPIQEDNTFDFRSRVPGVMHACGHDAHMASLVGTAMILSRVRDVIHGSIRFVFQPGEEKLPGGAVAMIREGVLAERNGTPAATAVLGQHVRPDLSVGQIGVRPGPFMASTDEIHIIVRGEGGHAAEPHRLKSDAVLVASHVIVALQAVISRHRPPDVPSVLSFGRIEADGAANVIPDEVVLRGTFRSMQDQWRQRGHELIRRITENTARAHGGEADCLIVTGYPALVNEVDLTGWFRETAIEYAGAENVIDIDHWFAGEDFAYFAQQVPSCFYVLGTGGDNSDARHKLHTSRFTIDEDALTTGAGLMAYAAWKFCDSGGAVVAG